MEFIGTCSDPHVARIAESCNRIANKKKLEKLVKEQYPDLYESLWLGRGHNPYKYYQNKKYYDLVHSSIDYVFLK